MPPDPFADDGDSTFEIGLSMSGAISAGAYTAGVFDFLIEALDQWDMARKAETRAPAYDGPQGQARIKVLAGASAGAIAAGIGTVALSGDEKAEPGKYTLGRLYEAWVVKPSLMSTDGRAPDMLSLDDLTESGKPIAPVSLLNSRRLTEIAMAALEVKEPAKRREYISDKLHIYMTLTDLRGTPYAIDFKGPNGYNMLSHSNRAHFIIEGLGAWSTKSPFADDDSSTALKSSALFATTAPSDWKAFATAAVGSGGFPIGLAPRMIESKYGSVKFPTGADGPPKLIDTTFDPVTFPRGKSYNYVAVDGGVLDNDPFEYARFTLMTAPPAPNEREAGKTTRAVIMISAFPEAPRLVAEGAPSTAITSIASSVLDTLRQQARFKPDQLLAAMSESVFSRFMVSPTRVAPNQTLREKFSLATGLLGGFGGFIAREFRDHDYQLGRRNCQQFLRETFVLPASRGYFDGWSDAGRAGPTVKLRESDSPAAPEVDALPIIPLYGTAAADVPFPAWERVPLALLDTLMDRISRRFSAVAANMIANEKLTVRVAILWKALLALGKDRIINYIRWAILTDLILRDQIKEFDLPAALIHGMNIPGPILDSLKLPPGPDGKRYFVRSILSCLTTPKYEYRTVRGLSEDLAPNNPGLALCVQLVLDELTQVESKLAIAVWKASWTSDDKESVYTLAMRAPSLPTQWLRGRSIGTFFSAPKID